MLDVALPPPPQALDVNRLLPFPAARPVYVIAGMGRNASRWDYYGHDAIEWQRGEIPGPAGLIELFGGEQAFRALLASRRVEMTRIRSDKAFIGWVPVPAEIESARVNADDASALLWVATRDATYHWRDFDRESAPDFRFRLKFHSPRGPVFIDLSFEDRILSVVRGEVRMGSAHFDFGRDEFAALIDHYFPGALRLNEDR